MPVEGRGQHVISTICTYLSKDSAKPSTIESLYSLSRQNTCQRMRKRSILLCLHSLLDDFRGYSYSTCGLCHCESDIFILPTMPLWQVCGGWTYNFRTRGRQHVYDVWIGDVIVPSEVAFERLVCQEEGTSYVPEGVNH